MGFAQVRVNQKLKKLVCNIKYQINPLNLNRSTALHYQPPNHLNNNNPYAVLYHTGLY